MPRVAKAATEKPVENNEKTVIKNSEFEVKDYLKTHGSIMVGTQFVPIVDGKVKASARLKEVLEKSGFLK